MSRKTLRPRLGVESLERRDTPTTWVVGDLNFDWSFEAYPSITNTNGSVKIQGTGSDDIIRVENWQPVLSQDSMAFSFNSNVGDNAIFGDQIMITVTDAQGNVRTDMNGNPLRHYYQPSSVNIIEANALGGNDRTLNTTNKVMVHAGGEGNDTLSGGSNMDILNGGNGDDSLTGGDGNDQLYGMAGQDRLYGNNGNDLMQSGEQNDSLYGGYGNDKMDGEGGEDFFMGGPNNDTMSGGDGWDTMLGEAGNDVMHGDAGNDLISGGSENDDLFGDAGNDDLQGFSGNDGLFGGSGHEYLTGGGGYDRFLKWEATGNKTTIVDQKSYDSVTVFKNTTSTTVFTVQGHKLRYAPAAWSEAEIAQVDSGLSFMHHEVGNVKLLKRSNGSNMAMLRFGGYIAYNEVDGNNDANDLKANELGVSFAGFNTNDGRVFFNGLTFDGSTYDVASTVIHELAHNWDNENSKFTQWKALSGWVNKSTPGTNQTLSKDKKWVYTTGTEFARDYGKTNPYEDFSTTFEAYYALKMGKLSYDELVRQTAKLNFIGLFITQMGQ
jgi:hypothetical protein